MKQAASPEREGARKNLICFSFIKKKRGSRHILCQDPLFYVTTAGFLWGCTVFYIGPPVRSLSGWLSSRHSQTCKDQFRVMYQDCLKSQALSRLVAGAWLWLRLAAVLRHAQDGLCGITSFYMPSLFSQNSGVVWLYFSQLVQP